MFTELMFFLIGLALGSFANVYIYRVPRNLSVVKPSSRCVRCGKTIRWFYNVPLISFIVLRGRCSSCRAPISFSYPLVELLTGVIFFLIYHEFGFTFQSLLFCAFAWCLLVVSFIDLYHKIIPDSISYSLIIGGIITSPFNNYLGDTLLKNGLFSAVGAISGFGIGLFIARIGEKIFKKEVFGGGDIKLLAGVGAFMGWTVVLKTIFYASLLGSIISIALIIIGRIKKDDYIPFGPFIATSALILLF